MDEDDDNRNYDADDMEQSEQSGTVEATLNYTVSFHTDLHLAW